MTDIKKYRWLIVVMIVYYAVFFGTGRIIKAGGSASYMLAIIATVVSAVIYTALYRVKDSKLLYAKYKNTDIRKIVGVFLFVSALVQATAVCSYSVVSITQVFMKKSPFPYILLFVLLPTLFGAYFGIKSVSRYCFIAGVSMVFLIALILAFAYEDYSFKNIYPVMGKGFPRFGGIVSSIFAFSNIFYLFLLSGREEKNNIKGEILKIILISGAVFTAICLVCNLTVPFEALEQLSDPLLYVSSTVDFSFAVERSEALVFLVWIFMTFLTLSASMCFVCSIAENTFSLANRKALIGALAIVVATGSMLIDKWGKGDWFINFSLFWTGCVSIIIPLLLRIMSFFRKEQS